MMRDNLVGKILNRLGLDDLKKFIRKSEIFSDKIRQYFWGEILKRSITKKVGHPFMTFTTKIRFSTPSPCPHASTWAGPPCGRPHAVDMKYTPLS